MTFPLDQNQPLANSNAPSPSISRWTIGLQILGVFSLLCLRFLLDSNVGTGFWNEGDVLPLARQAVQPDWIPTDWYLNQPAGYRLLFQTLVGRLITIVGFLGTSLIGRGVCYALVATGMVLLAQKIGLRFVLLLVVVVLFLNFGNLTEDWDQGLIANEWLVRGLEAKAVAYGLVLLVLRLLLDRRYRWAALLVGVATSFHVLVGGWATLACAGFFLWKQRSLRSLSLPLLRDIILLYLLGSSFALPAIVTQLTSTVPAASISPSYLYVFVRLPHHLNPLSWRFDRWVRAFYWISVFSIALVILWYQKASDSHGQRSIWQSFLRSQRPWVELVQFTSLSLIPFGIGLLIAPIDRQGIFLQYYPFRLGDVLFPLTTLLLAAYALQLLAGRYWRILQGISLVAIALLISLQGPMLQQQMAALPQFPGSQQGVTPEMQDLATWIRQNTDPKARFVSAPVEFDNFTWLTERATIAKFKLLPQSKAGIVDWYERLSDLSGDRNWSEVPTRTDRRDEIRQQLTDGYNQLQTPQVRSVLQKYQAEYIVTRRNHRLDLPLAYQNSRYRLYSQ